MDKKAKKRIEVLQQRLPKLRQLLAGARGGVGQGESHTGSVEVRSLSHLELESRRLAGTGRRSVVRGQDSQVGNRREGPLRGRCS